MNILPESKYIDLPLKNPIIVAPGSLTLNIGQINKIKNAGYAGAILKSVIGESKDESSSMKILRKKPTHIDTFYDSYDTKGEFPIIHWDGGLDTRNLNDYMPFANEAQQLNKPSNFSIIASFLANLPHAGEEFIEEEWIHTANSLKQAGYKYIELDFCPFLSGEDYIREQGNVLRWYKRTTEMVKSIDSNLKAIPKMLNLAWGMDFQVKIADAAVEGGADGLVVCNRIFKPEYKSGHGGEELRLRNLEMIKRINQRHPNLPISATGGIYRGRHVYEYLKAGAQNVQVLSFIMGKVKPQLEPADANKFEQVFYKLMHDKEDGLISIVEKEGSWK